MDYRCLHEDFCASRFLLAIEDKDKETSGTEEAACMEHQSLWFKGSSGKKLVHVHSLWGGNLGTKVQ